MTTFSSSAARYETWLKAQLGSDFVTDDLVEKHRKMRKDAFTFLRATYWRWAETILDICPEFAGAPAVLAIGDTHLENFGTWRDLEGRLIWGANDFDEGAEMPYPLDLVRLATSAILAGDFGPTATEICDALARGYADGLANPAPIVLERDYRWMREAVILSEDNRTKFWSKFDVPSKAIPQRFAKALVEALPAPMGAARFFPRTAGTGSLGRPKFVAVGEWQGGPVLREAKAILPSTWSLCHGEPNEGVRAGEIATGQHRAPDPHYQVADGIVCRRLSPNSRKIEVKDAAVELLNPDMLRTMGREIGNCHANDAARIVSLRDDLAKRREGWLKKAAKRAAEFIGQEQSEYASAHG